MLYFDISRLIKLNIVYYFFSLSPANSTFYGCINLLLSSIAQIFFFFKRFKLLNNINFIKTIPI